MGMLIRFPEQVQSLRVGAANESRHEPATVIILPVVRIERYPDEPSAGAESGAGARTRRRRRGRATRS